MSKLDLIGVNMESQDMENAQELIEGARRLERFLLLPVRHQNEIATVRLHLRGQVSGWRLKDELVEAVGLTVGDAICVETELMLGPGIFEGSDDIDLFAGGEEASWLIDSLFDTGHVPDCVADCVVRFVCCYAPIGRDGRTMLKAAMVLEKGIKILENSQVSQDDLSEL